MSVSTQKPGPTTTVTRPARALHDSAIVVDGTCPGYHWRERLQTWIDGGATCCVVSFVAFEDCRRAVSLLAEAFRYLRERPDRLVLATSAEQIRQAKRDGRLAVVLHFQGTHALEYEADLVELFWRLGVRVVQLAYNQRSPVGDGCEEPSDAGLSSLGRTVVAELNRLGIVIDVSHTGARTSHEAVALSTAPVVASHSNPAGLHPSSRNISDALIRDLAATGGLIGINGFPGFLSAHSPPTLDRFVDAITYVADLVGVAHVGIGLDYTIRNPPMELYEQYVRDGIWSAATYPPPPWHFPAGLDDASGLPNLTQRLLDRGYTEDETRAVLGGNWLRVFDQVWHDAGSTT
ncbi:membrane dipeptidase [Nonomuraea longispora]|uniref:Membrane dipeptidase n=1 Tax=Nonomuraea longispora TaxID=1848320 RepID=A0A4R4NLP8_9ACTN|nr:membrane dipeptidase [Nonomuraea longispora]